MVGVIDEIRMVEMDKARYPILVDTKTRVQAKLPAEPQRRNGRYPMQRLVATLEMLLAENEAKLVRCSNFFSTFVLVWQASIDVLQTHLGQFSGW